MCIFPRDVGRCNYLNLGDFHWILYCRFSKKILDNRARIENVIFFRLDSESSEDYIASFIGTCIPSFNCFNVTEILSENDQKDSFIEFSI